MQDFLVENWRYIGATIAALVLFGGSKIKAILANIKIPALSGLLGNKTVVDKVSAPDEMLAMGSAELVDMDAIMHLRNRAVTIKDKELLLEIKNVSSKIFDLYSNIDNSDTI